MLRISSLPDFRGSVAWYRIMATMQYMACGKIQLQPRQCRLPARCSTYSNILAPRSRTRMGTTKIVASAMKPALLQQIGAVKPTLCEVVEGPYDFSTLRDEASFLAKKGPSIRGVKQASKEVPSCDPTTVEKTLVIQLPISENVSSFDHKDGNKEVDVDLSKRLGVQVTNGSRDALTYLCAATAQQLLMAISQEVCSMGRYRRASRWPSDSNHSIPYRLCNKHVGIVGLEPIGAAIAKKVENLNCTIGYCGRSQNPLYPDYVYFNNVVDLARHSDVLIVGCSPTDQTTKIINREVLDALGPQGFVVNVSSDPVIDEKALADALMDGRIAGAGLNLFDNGAQVPDELVNNDNCVLQFHAYPRKGEMET